MAVPRSTYSKRITPIHGEGFSPSQLLLGLFFNFENETLSMEKR